METRVLVVGLERGLYGKIEPLLLRSNLSVDRVPKGESGLYLAARVLFHLLVVRHPLPDMALGSFISAVHEPGAMCGASPILVLADDFQLEELRRLLPGGDKQVLSIKEPAKLLQEVASRLLHVAARIALRVHVRLQVQLQEGTSLVACQTENFSEKGMLVRTPTLYPIGTKVRFECTLPADRSPIAGDAEVARHSVPDIEQVSGIGLKILAFQGDSARRLRRFLEGKK
jgi:hypothetical protein